MENLGRINTETVVFIYKFISKNAYVRCSQMKHVYFQIRERLTSKWLRFFKTQTFYALQVPPQVRNHLYRMRQTY